MLPRQRPTERWRLASRGRGYRREPWPGLRLSCGYPPGRDGDGPAADEVGASRQHRGDGLVERLSAKAVLPYGKSSMTVESSTRYADWGREVTVLLPLQGDVLDPDQPEDKVPAAVPGIWN